MIIILHLVSCISDFSFSFFRFASQNLKSHAVTMFEVGKLSDETLDSFLMELEKVKISLPSTMGTEPLNGRQTVSSCESVVKRGQRQESLMAYYTKYTHLFLFGFFLSFI